MSRRIITTSKMCIVSHGIQGISFMSYPAVQWEEASCFDNNMLLRRSVSRIAIIQVALLLFRTI